MAASLLLALLAWFLVTVREKIEVGYLVPLVFEKVPAALALDGTPLGSVYVRLRGSRHTVENILPQQLQARVDLAGAGVGSNFVQITPQMVTLPRGVELLGISPSYLDLTFLARAAVPVRVRTAGTPAPGFVLVSAVADPPEVAVVGPPERVAPVARVETEPLSLEGRRAPFRQRAELVAPSHHVRLLELRPTEVVVEIAPQGDGRGRRQGR
jgi:YbbR domain-containing protein